MWVPKPITSGRNSARARSYSRPRTYPAHSSNHARSSPATSAALIRMPSRHCGSLPLSCMVTRAVGAGTLQRALEVQEEEPGSAEFPALPSHFVQDGHLVEGRRHAAAVLPLLDVPLA